MVFNCKVIVYIATLALVVNTAVAIKCYQCTGTDSKNPFQCNEFLNDYDIAAESCDLVYGAQYCIKHIGRFEGGIGTKRYCSSHDLGNYCDYVKQIGDIMEYRSCVYTCTGDGCNSSTNLKPFIMLSFVTLILAIWV